MGSLGRVAFPQMLPLFCVLRETYACACLYWVISGLATLFYVQPGPPGLQ